MTAGEFKRAKMTVGECLRPKVTAGECQRAKVNAGECPRFLGDLLPVFPPSMPIYAINVHKCIFNL